MLNKVRDADLYYYIGGTRLVFPQEILEIGISLEFVKKKKRDFFFIGERQHFKELL